MFQKRGQTVVNPAPPYLVISAPGAFYSFDVRGRRATHASLLSTLLWMCPPGNESNPCRWEIDTWSRDLGQQVEKLVGPGADYAIHESSVAC